MKSIDSPSKGAVTMPPDSPSLPLAAERNWKLGRVAFVLLVLIIIAAAAGIIPRLRQRAALRAETHELAVPTVSVVFPAPGKALAGLTLSAEVKPFVEAPIYARASGYLKRWLVDIGAQVQAGELLAEIDTPELNQELAHTRAELVQADAALALARTTAARWAELLKTSSVSDQEAAEKQADFQVKAANVEAAQANVHRLEELQAFRLVTAPFAGTITTRRTDVGELIAATSGKELFRLAQTRTLRVYVRIPQTSARAVAVGQIAEVSIPELPGKIFSGKVVRNSGAMSSDSRTLLTEIEVDNQTNEIMSGSYAQVRFIEAKGEAALTLPANTLLFRAEGPQLGVIGQDGKVELRTVVLGRDFGQTFEVLGGVQATDRVIVNPPDSITDRESVRILQSQGDESLK